VGSEHYVAESSVLSADAEQGQQGQQGQSGGRAGKGRQGAKQAPRRPAEQLDAAALGIRFLRGGEVVEVLDETQAVVGERDENGRERQPLGNVRTFRLALDAAQYQLDQERMLATQGDDAEDVYASFNLLVRRKAKENNFKAVLETIRDLMNTECVCRSFARPLSVLTLLPCFRSFVLRSFTLRLFEHLPSHLPSHSRLLLTPQLLRARLAA
jgi:hypothetical protein